jgi:hypothetical protein
VTEAENACEALRFLRKKNKMMENVECLCVCMPILEGFFGKIEQNFASDISTYTREKY